MKKCLVGLIILALLNSCSGNHYHDGVYVNRNSNFKADTIELNGNKMCSKLLMAGFLSIQTYKCIQYPDKVVTADYGDLEQHPYEYTVKENGDLYHPYMTYEKIK